MPTEIAIAQFIAYVTLTLSSVTVATVSLIFSYRQNLGWTPVFMVTGQGYKRTGKEPKTGSAVLTFEFWNRRTYPIVVREIALRFRDLEFDKVRARYEQWRFDINGHAWLRSDELIDGKGHHTFQFIGPLPDRSLDDLRSAVDIMVVYFDPRRNKVFEIRQTFDYRLK